jgi:hypothetical protein
VQADRSLVGRSWPGSPLRVLGPAS